MAAPVNNPCRSVLFRYARLEICNRVQIACASQEAGDAESHGEVQTNMARLKPSLLLRVRGIPQQPLTEEMRPKPSWSVFARKFNAKQFNRKLYARHGKASNVDPGTLWPDQIAIERELSKLQLQEPVANRIAKLQMAKQQQQIAIDQHQKLIAERMAKMPEFIKQHENRKQKVSVKNQEQIAKREKLLEEAREFFGYEVHYKDLKFQQMMEWKEEEERRKKKQLKKRSKENHLADKIAKMTSELKQSDGSS